MRKSNQLLLVFIVIFITTAVIPGLCVEKSNKSRLLNTLNASGPLFAISDSVGPIIGTPTLDDTTPDSDEPVEVTAPINDVDGIQNATLYWQYKSLNSTLFNTTVNASPALVVDTAQFIQTGYVNSLGWRTGSSTDWRYGNYLYNSSVVTAIDVTVDVSYPTILVYLLIKAKNITTGLWEIVYEQGSYGETQTDLGPETYTSTDLTLGYEIHAVTYRSTITPWDPYFSFININREECNWTIPAANEPTFVDYYITAFDDLNQSSTSPAYTFLMDHTPYVNIIDVPAVLRADEDYVVNITATDADGANTINTSSGIVYYQFSGDSPDNWTVISLNHFGEFSNVHYFIGTIPASNLGNIETRLYVRANVSDIVDGIKGREGTVSWTRSVRIDSLFPRVTDIDIDGGVNNIYIPPPVPAIIENVTLPTSPVNITVDFFDDRGVSSVSIYYSLPNGTTPIKLNMTNLTSVSQYIDDATFYATLPPSNETAFVEYFFETEDFFGNKGNTSSNFYYSDGSAPNFDDLLLYPSIISNYTEVHVLFNCSDYSDLRQPVIWYSFDNQISWTSSSATTIDYGNEIDYKETFIITDLPYLIEDKSMSYIPLEIIRHSLVDTAILRLNITHELITDLRIRLRLDDGRVFMIHDREHGTQNVTREIDLFELGLNQSDFTRGNFTLEIEDFSEFYSGTVRNYSIEISHHGLPLGYQYQAIIPATNNDTAAYYYMNLTDNLWNSKLTSIYQYYSDGLPPNVSVKQHISSLDLSGGHSIRVYADVTDTGGIFDAEVYYRFSEGTEWIVDSMSLNTTSGLYFFDVFVPSANGTLTYKVRAYDLSGLSNETRIYTTSFSSGLGPVIEVQGMPYPSPLDMEDKNTIRIWANVTDDGSIVNCTIFYQFDDDTNETIDMIFDNTTGFYYADIQVQRSSGNLTFIVSATDDMELTSVTEPYTIQYENAGTTPGFPTEILLIGALILGGGAVAGTGVYLFKSGRLKLPRRSSD